MDKTDLTNVLVLVFKISSTGSYLKYIGHLGEIQFSFSQPPFRLL